MTGHSRAGRVATRAKVHGYAKAAAIRSSVTPGIIELHEVEAFGTHDALKISKGARRVVRDAEIADAPRFLPLAQDRQMNLPIHQIVNLHQVDPVRLQQLE